MQFYLKIWKGWYWYEYIDSWKKYEEIKLPPKNAFCRKLSMKGINDNDHEYVQQVWNTMEKRTLGRYQNTYLKTDLLLFADVLTLF